MNVLTGQDPLDPASSHQPVPDFTSDLDRGLDGLKIGIPSNHFFDDSVDQEVKASVLSAIELMAQNGAEIVELPMPWVTEGRAINLGIIRPEAVAAHQQEIPYAKAML